jgi:Ser/Thr protein kinase RdoA (MazF antagonist)
VAQNTNRMIQNSFQTSSALIDIAGQFAGQGKVINIQPFGSGNINDTFLVTLNSLGEACFVLQRINTQVFRQPELVMQNMRTFTEHVFQRLQCDPLSPGCRWQVPRVLLARGDRDYWVDGDGLFWRAISFIEGSQSFDTIQSMEHAKEIGYALGMFHRLISDLPSEQLADTLEGFHITPQYLKHYDTVLAQSDPKQSTEVDYCLQFVRDRKVLAHVLETAKAQGKLPLRTIHGDPKINNIMLDTVTQQAVSMIDLDTVKPGLVHYDIGDCLRSGCNLLGEETDEWETVRFDVDLCQTILEGYLSQARDFLTDYDYDYIYDGIRLIAFELGLRFFTDYLAGNIYFKVKHPDHNLLRALVQFRLTESIEAQASAIQTIVKGMR